MKKIILIQVLLLLFGCGDEYMKYSACIDNQTQETIKVYFFLKTAYIQSVDSIICFPNKSNVYYKVPGSVLKNIDCNPRINKDEVKVVISNGKILKKDISDPFNWICERNKNISWQITFKVTESDLK